MARSTIVFSPVLLRKWRVIRELTQGDLARRVGFTTSFIEKLEGGQREPSMKTVNLLGHALGVDPIKALFARKDIE